MILNFLSCLSSLSADCSFCGVIGTDEESKEICKLFENKKIDIKNIYKNSKDKTYTCFIILDKTGEKILIINPTNNIFINNKDINYNNLEFFDHIHTTSGNIETVHSIKENVKKYNNTLSIDVENISSFNILKDITKNIDIVFMNKKTSNNCNLSTEDINEFILENNIEILCLTNGNKGAEIFSKDKHIKESAISVNVVDTTGAGDCFAAGFIYSYLKNKFRV